jgi:hypothetical protein
MARRSTLLQQVGSDFRLQLQECTTSPRLQCRFIALRVAVLVQGRDSPPRIATIVISADLLREGPTTKPLATITDVVLVFGASIVVFDPDLLPDRRVQLLSDTVERALTTGTSEESGLAADYALKFDEAASGLLVIVITPRT